MEWYLQNKIDQTSFFFGDLLCRIYHSTPRWRRFGPRTFPGSRTRIVPRLRGPPARRSRRRSWTMTSWWSWHCYGLQRTNLPGRRILLSRPRTAGRVYVFAPYRTSLQFQSQKIRPCAARNRRSTDFEAPKPRSFRSGSWLWLKLATGAEHFLLAWFIWERISPLYTNDAATLDACIYIYIYALLSVYILLMLHLYMLY